MISFVLSFCHERSVGSAVRTRETRARIADSNLLDDFLFGSHNHHHDNDAKLLLNNMDAWGSKISLEASITKAQQDLALRWQATTTILQKIFFWWLLGVNTQ